MSDAGEEKRREIMAQKEAVLRQMLSAEARARLANVRLVRPELADTVENYLIGMVNQGRLSPPVSDTQMKQLLMSLQQPKRDFRMNRV